jgi:hypothetical protein
VADYPSAITPGAEDKSGAVDLGVRWVLQQQREVGGEILLDVPNSHALTEWKGIAALSKRPNVRVSKRGRGFPNGPVLAVWPTADAFTQLLSHDRDIRALCLMPWQAPQTPLAWVTGWARASSAELLGAAYVPAGNVGLEKVVRRGLEDLVGNVGGALGRGFVKSSIKILADAGYPLPPDQVRAYMLEIGCNPSDAQDAFELSGRIAQGSSLRWPQVGRIEHDPLNDWETDSEE